MRKDSVTIGMSEACASDGSLFIAQEVDSWRGAKRFVRQLFIARPKEAILLVALVCIAAVTHARAWVEFSQINGVAQTALSKRDEDTFWESRWDLIRLIFKLVATSLCEDYCAGRLRLIWRSVATHDILTQYLPVSAGPGLTSLALSKFASRRIETDCPFYKLKLPSASGCNSQVMNPDQRIADDIESLITDVVDLGRSLLGNIVSFVSFAFVMLQQSPMVFHALLVYAFVCTFITLRGFAKGLTSAQIKVRDREAHFRCGLIKVDDCAEAIAFYGAANAERYRLFASLQALLHSSFRVLHWQMGLQSFQRTNSWFTLILPSVIMAPQYFRGEVEFGAFSQMFFAFNSVKGVLMFAANNFGSLAAMRAKIQRVEALHCSVTSRGNQASLHTQQINAKDPFESTHPEAQSNIIRERCFGSLPSGALLRLGMVLVAAPSTGPRCWLGTVDGDSSGSNVQVLPGEALLLRGRSGVGKSSLLRVVAGLWDEGSGLVQFGTSEVIFLPQSPYVPFGASKAASSLREQLLFPAGISELPQPQPFRNAESLIVPCNSTTTRSPTDSDLIEALAAAGLGHVREAVGGLDADVDWSTRLSGGERQQLAFARIFARLPKLLTCDCNPSLVLLDEATAACDEETESHLYAELMQRVRERGGAIISVGHRSSLVSLHTCVAELRTPSLQ